MTIEKKDKEISRKDFLKGVGVSLAGVTLLGGVGGVLTACSDQATAAPEPIAGESEKPQWPFTYVKVDPDKAAIRGYDAYKTGAG
ncbi:hypothetical protein SAMN05446037_1004155 [Anaerovirgula multivorans]|uniref:Tat (Twin-arginine translocation) pathway signal sequence n=2 Tax=Anaerovirgula multivorans TaxID=312168 RepID=A0A239BXE6_9FIRM|nr:hypothetical protein SAMN05446037_1004155 [Anaerovirgula multivorans]